MVRLTKPLRWLLIVAMTGLSLPRAPARAAMVPTEAVVAEQTVAAAQHQRIRALIERAEVRAGLKAYGVDPEEALARVDSLSDREVAEITARLDRLPAGGGDPTAVFYGTLLAIVIIILVGIFVGFQWLFEQATE